jgi:hypothetical protein
MSASTGDTERSWPKRNPVFDDIELQDEVVNELQRLWDASLANLVIAGQPNPAIAELEEIERVAIANGVILPTRQGAKSLLRMMAEGIIVDR